MQGQNGGSWLLWSLHDWYAIILNRSRVNWLWIWHTTEISWVWYIHVPHPIKHLWEHAKLIYIIVSREVTTEMCLSWKSVTHWVPPGFALLLLFRKWLKREKILLLHGRKILLVGIKNGAESKFLSKCLQRVVTADVYCMTSISVLFTIVISDGFHDNPALLSDKWIWTFRYCPLLPPPGNKYLSNPFVGWWGGREKQLWEYSTTEDPMYTDTSLKQLFIWVLRFNISLCLCYFILVASERLLLVNLVRKEAVSSGVKN